MTNYIKFPWLVPNSDPQFQSNWDHIYKLFTDWPFHEENLHIRRKNLNRIFRGKIPSQLFLLSDKFVSIAGPLDFMIKAVIKAPSTFPKGLLRMVPNEPNLVYLSKRKVFIIMSICFFNLISNYRYATMLDHPQYTLCIANYFEYSWNKAKTDPNWFDQIICIEKRVLDKDPNWAKSTNKLCDLNIYNGIIGIEDFRDSFQVNFADPIPGGTLPSPLGDIVQEEILFLIYPELFIVPLFIFKIGQSEACIIRNVSRTNNYSGYRTSFMYKGNYTIDSKLISIIFMDAVPNGGDIIKDLNKAFVGFSADTNGLSIATGHWGCGVFGGDKISKSIIQLIAASEANRNLNYTMFGDECEGFKEFYDRMVLIQATIGEIYLGLMHSSDNYYMEITNHIFTSRKKYK